jgi:translation initiation factor 2 beta subunit (eIF-2beta)/eIF-5
LVKIGAVETPVETKVDDKTASPPKTKGKRKHPTGITCADCGEKLDRDEPHPCGKEGFICLGCNRFFPGLDFEGDECPDCTNKMTKKRQAKEAKEKTNVEDLEKSLQEAASTFEYIRHTLKANSDHEAVAYVDVLSRLPLDSIQYLIKAARSKFIRHLPLCPQCGRRVSNIIKEKGKWLVGCQTCGTGPIENWSPAPSWLTIIAVEDFITELSNVPKTVKEVIG